MTVPSALAPYSKVLAAILAAVAASVASGADWRVVLASAIGALLVFIAPANVQ